MDSYYCSECDVEYDRYEQHICPKTTVSTAVATVALTDDATVANFWVRYFERRAGDTRDPARIPIMLEALRKVWEQNPDLRLTQLVINSARALKPATDPFYVEDDSVLKVLEMMER